ncbi:histidine kinase [Leptospira sp. 96542]|nr:histidine kinase [Leptospira sp. 96542]
MRRIFSRFFPSIPLEPISIYAVYSEILSKLYILGIAFGFAYLQSVYLEWGFHNPVNFFLSLFQSIVAICLLFISIFYRRIFTWAPPLVRVLYFILVLLEIETGFHDPNIVYFDPRNWLTIIAIMWVCSFFYPGRVWQFVTEWSILFFFYLTRVHYENGGSIPNETWREMTTIVPLFFVCFFLHHWWFRTRYTSAYRGILLGEKKKSFMQDTHDSIGSHLTEIMMITKKMESSPKPDLMEDLKKLRQISDNALSQLRSQLVEDDQKEILRTSFLKGLRILLKQRYKLAGRNIKFQWDQKWNETNIRLVDNNEIIHNLFMLFSEVTSSDLKYGQGTSILKLSIERESIWFHFSSLGNDGSKTDHFFQEGDGMGETILISRVESLGGKLSISKLPYTIQIILPPKWFEWEN